MEFFQFIGLIFSIYFGIGALMASILYCFNTSNDMGFVVILLIYSLFWPWCLYDTIIDRFKDKQKKK